MAKTKNFLKYPNYFVKPSYHLLASMVNNNNQPDGFSFVKNTAPVVTCSIETEHEDMCNNLSVQVYTMLNHLW